MCACGNDRGIPRALFFFSFFVLVCGTVSLPVLELRRERVGACFFFCCLVERGENVDCRYSVEDLGNECCTRVVLVLEY